MELVTRVHHVFFWLVGTPIRASNPRLSLSTSILYQGCSWTKLEFLVYKGLIRVVGHGNPRLAMGTHGYPPFLLRKWVGERGYPWAPTIFSCDELCAIWELGVSGHGLPRVSVWR